MGDRAESTDLSWEQQALQSIGYETDDLSAVEDPGAAGPSERPRMRHPRLRYVFQHTLHGEATVQTEDGVRTVVAQRGTVTEVTGDAITVRSTDGFVLTWRLTDRTVVVVNRAKSQIADVKVGTEVGVAGARDGDAVNARLVVVPRD
jgi:hypothetical protein